MALPGFLSGQTAPSQRKISAPTDRRAPDLPSGEMIPATCAWYDYFYAPVACGFVARNQAYGVHGYGGRHARGGRSPWTRPDAQRFQRARTEWARSHSVSGD